jgi:hypothetical protein
MDVRRFLLAALPFFAGGAACLVVIHANPRAAARGPGGGQEPRPQVVDRARPEPDPAAEREVPDRQRFLDRIKKLVSKETSPTGEPDRELRQLLIARRKAAMDRAEAFDALQGLSLAEMFQAYSLVLQAQEELTSDPVDRLEIAELRLVIARAREAREAGRLEARIGTVQDVAEARFNRIGFEIAVVRAKRALTRK